MRSSGRFLCPRPASDLSCFSYITTRAPASSYDNLLQKLVLRASRPRSRVSCTSSAVACSVSSAMRRRLRTLVICPQISMRQASRYLRTQEVARCREACFTLTGLQILAGARKRHLVSVGGLNEAYYGFKPQAKLLFAQSNALPPCEKGRGG